jgi:hypothetical protein
VVVAVTPVNHNVWAPILETRLDDVEVAVVFIEDGVQFAGKMVSKIPFGLVCIRGELEQIGLALLTCRVSSDQLLLENSAS